MPVKKRYLIICASLVVLILLLLLTGGEEETVDKKKRNTLAIDIVELSTRDHEVSTGYIGTLYPAHKFELHSKVGGRIVEMKYGVSDMVENGATIALIDDNSYLLELKQARARLNIEESKIRQKQMSIELADKEYQRMLALRAEKVVSESSLEKAKYDLEQNKITLEVDQANLKMQETAVELSELKWSYTKINAQWSDGTETNQRYLAERFVDEGAIITPNTTIATILDIEVLKAEIFVGENQYPHFKPGMKVKISADSFPGETFEGTVERIAPFINQQTQQAKVSINVPNEDLKLRPGMFVWAQVHFRTREAVPMLPKVCVTTEKGKQGVFLYDAEQGKVLFHPVQTGVTRSGMVEIVNASEIDRPVVSIGQHMLKHNQSVKLVETPEANQTVKGAL
ncbi:MAG: efflux RND transporter periplasmic adaptor subunit [Opitutaceae bacterium]